MFNRSWTQIQPAFDVDRDWFSVVSVCKRIVTLVSQTLIFINSHSVINYFGSEL
jgi:hypothetical protein